MFGKRLFLSAFSGIDFSVFWNYEVSAQCMIVLGCVRPFHSCSSACKLLLISGRNLLIIGINRNRSRIS